MGPRKKKRLQDAGFRAGSVAEFLGLSEVELALVEMKLGLSQSLRSRRARCGMTQAELAKQLHSSKSRVAKMEAGNPSVSLDLMVHALVLVGATRRQVANALLSRTA